jgi:hypothetical protein
MEALVSVALIVLILAVTTIALLVFQRGLEKPGGRDGLGSIGDAFGNMIEILDPGQDRGARNLKSHENQGPITKSPDDDLDRPVYVEAGPDGRPRAVRVKRLPPVS